MYTRRQSKSLFTYLPKKIHFCMDQTLTGPETLTMEDYWSLQEKRIVKCRGLNEEETAQYHSRCLRECQKWSGCVSESHAYSNVILTRFFLKTFTHMWRSVPTRALWTQSWWLYFEKVVSCRLLRRNIDQYSYTHLIGPCAYLFSITVLLLRCAPHVFFVYFLRPYKRETTI